MANKKPKRPRDPNQLAKLMVNIATGQAEQRDLSPAGEKAAKGGKIGGPARAMALTPEKRSKIASNAAQARWRKKDD